MKKFIGALLLVHVFLFLLISVPALAQVDTTVVTPTTEAFFPDWVFTAMGFLVAIYEVVISYYPTVKDYSLISLIMRIFRTLVPNKNAQGGTHKV